MTKLQLGQYRDSLAGFEEALWLYSTHGKWTLYAQTLQMSATATLELGEYQPTEARLLEALEILGQQVQPFLVHVLSSLTTLYLEWPAPHAPTLARKYALHAQWVTEQLQNPMSHCIAALGLARLALSEGQGVSALEQAQTLLEQPRAIGAQELVLNAQIALGLAFAATGQFVSALEQLQAAMRDALSHEMPLEGHKISLEIARIDGDALRAAQRFDWFVAHGLHNGANLAQRYFPQVSAALKVRPTLRLEVLGDIRLHISGSSQALRGHQRQELLIQLLEARLFHESEAAGALKQVVFKLRSACGASAIITTPQSYALGAITSDVEDFLNSGDTRLWLPYQTVHSSC